MNFEDLMRSAQSAHLNQEYQTALVLRFKALGVADTLSEQGRASRDVGASFDRLGDTTNSGHWAQEAYLFHDDAVIAKEPGALRERAASAMYVGGIALRSAVQLERAGEEHISLAEKGLDYLGKGLENIKEHEREHGGTIDQYRINMTGRVAIAEGLYGSRKRGLSLGAKAVGLAFLSESAMTSTYNLAMPREEKRKARINAGMRGIAAIAVSLLSIRPTRKIALRTAERAL